MKDPDLPIIEYTEEEKGVWKYCYPKLMELFKKNACKEFLWTIE